MTALHQPAALVPFTGAGVAQPCVSAWSAAMQKVERARAIGNAALARFDRARRAYEAMDDQGPLALLRPPVRPDAEIDRLTGYSGAATVLDEAMNAECAAVSALILTPAADLAALLWKLEHLFGEEADAGAGTACYCAEWGAALMSDARRLLATGRA